MDIDRFRKKPLLGILRGPAKETVEPLVESAVAAGLEALELAMNTPDAVTVLDCMVRASRGRLMIGAGTVLDQATLDAALSAGATFIVSPVVVDEVVAHCKKNGIPVFPGALTPAEIHRAWQAGATMVKVFPAQAFGPQYFKEVKGPFNDIELLACGGINAATIGDYFAKGASAAAFGASIFKKEWIVEGRYDLVESAIKALVAALPASHVSGRN